MDPRRYGPFAYSPIIDRPVLRWPNGARVAIWIIPNIEFFPLDATITGQQPIVPNILPWARRDYGNRIGVVRMMDVMAQRNICGTVALNSDIANSRFYMRRADAAPRSWRSRYILGSSVYRVAFEFLMLRSTSSQIIKTRVATGSEIVDAYLDQMRKPA